MRLRSPSTSRPRRWITRTVVSGTAIAAVITAALVAPGLAAAEDVGTKSVTHRVPFPCGQTWQGETRTNHSPQLAIDFNREGDHGDRVTASAGGRVVHRGEMAGTSYGRLVVIQHGDGTASYYAHLSEYRVPLGAQVGKGEVIGLVGGSGTPETPGGFGSHLHYEQRTGYNGSSVQIRFNTGAAFYYGIRGYTSSC